MIIDSHAHVGDLRASEDADQLPVTWEGLIERVQRPTSVEAVAVIPPRGHTRAPADSVFVAAYHVSVAVQPRPVRP